MYSNLVYSYWSRILVASAWLPEAKLQLGQDGLGARLVNGLGVVLLAGVDDLAVVDGDGVARGALTNGPANALAELGVGVGGEDLWSAVGIASARGRLASKPAHSAGEGRSSGGEREGNLAHHIVISHAVGLAPRGHDEGVVEGDDDDLVDALLLEGVAVVEVRGQVGGLAGGREGAGDGDEDDFLVLELCVGGTHAQTRVSRAVDRTWRGEAPAVATRS